MSAAATTLWARAFVDELARCGVREVAVAPGSRSTPLVLALAQHGGFQLRVHFDERSAAFFAVGVGKAGGGPAAVVTTSGTATANLFPAVVEAAQAEVPLLLLTADRPPALRGMDANQTIDQVRMFGGYVRGFFETDAPTLDAPSLRHLRGMACRAVAAALGSPAGPVHVNLPFEKPLEPVKDDPELAAFREAHPDVAGGRPDGEPFVRVERTGRAPTPREVARVAETLKAGGHAVLVAGPVPDPDRVGPAVVSLAREAGVPVLADPLSGARYADNAASVAVAGYDLFLGDPTIAEDLAPDVVVRFGSAPTSAALLRWLDRHRGARQVVVDGGLRWKDHAGTADHYLAADPRATVDELEHLGGKALGAGGAGREAATARWRAASDAARAALDALQPGDAHEGEIPARVAAALPDGAVLFASSSMPIRDLDAFAAPRSHAVRVLGNRGASGIDGIVSAAFGAAAGSGAPTVCVLGDLAFFHDQNGLLLARESDLAVVFVLVDNDGGGIFHMLPVAAHEPHFTRFFATPHGLDFRHAADLHRIPFVDATVADVGTAVRTALDSGGTHVVRVRTLREAGHEARRAAAQAVVAKVRAALDEGRGGG